jgi:RND family efflux transporter MFP subunit
VLAASVTGPVARVYVREGEMVRAGQPLVALNSEGFRLGLRQAEASLSSARAQLEAARVDYNRLRALLEDSAIPRSQFEAAESRYEVARAGHRAALVGLEQARKSLRDSVVRAPYAGLVVKRHVSEGDYATSLPPTELITLEETNVLDLRIQVPSSDSVHFRVGSWARARFPGTGKEIRVRIVRVVGSVDTRTRTFAAIAEIRNPGGKLRPGLYAQVLPEHRAGASPAGPE